MTRTTTGRLVAVLVAGGMLAAACGGVGAEEEGGGAGTAGGTLRVSGFAAGDEVATVRLDRFRETYPKADLQLNEGAFDAQQFLSAVAADDPPDVQMMGTNTVQAYAARGALQPLDACIEREGIDLSQVREGLLEPVTYRGHVYAVPEFFNYPVLLLNDRALAEAGLEPGDVDTGDWGSLMTAARKMTTIEDGTMTRLGFDPRLPDLTYLWPALHGVRTVSEDGLSFSLDEPATVEVVERLDALMDAQGGWGTVKSFRDTWDFFGDGNPMATDEVGAMVIEQWYLTVLAETAPKDVDFTVKPLTDASGKPLTMAYGNAWTIPKGSGQPDLGCKLAATMTDKASWVAAAKVSARERYSKGLSYGGTYSGNTAVDEVVFEKVWHPQGAPFGDFDRAVPAARRVMDSAVAVPPSPVGQQYTDALIAGMNRVLQGVQPPGASMRRTQDEVERAVEEFRSQR